MGKDDKAYNQEEIIGKVLFERHRQKVKTFVTTNENPSAIAARYGHHIGDRLPEMFNIIKWEGKSWRECLVQRSPHHIFRAFAKATA